MEANDILSPEATAFVADLERRFGPRRRELVALRAERRGEIARTGRLDFRPETREVREGEWQVPPPPPGLVNRRVEITGPTERKMAINALNSGAKVWLADHEDANTPHWSNVIGGQVNLYDAVRETIAFTAADGREYALTDGPRPTIVVRPRGWHLDERHFPVDGQPATGALLDFGLYAFHNAAELIARGTGPYFYLPKMESHLEARLWREVFDHAEDVLGLDRGTIRATVLIETITAAFEMQEILFELGPHAAALNAGRWDYLFSMIKVFRDAGSAFVLPERGAVTMTAPFMRAYTELLVRTCHRRGAHAIGGMAAVVPSRDPVAAKRALNQVRQDKRREVGDGFDGSWVAHPGLVATCREVFDQWLGAEPHQIVRKRDDVRVTATDLLDVKAVGVQVSEVALRTNVSVALRYIAAWLDGRGAVALNGLMEDAATAEICRAQLWQWIHASTPTDYGVPVSAALVMRMMREELDVLSETGALDEDAARRFGQARTLLTVLLTERTCPEFLTLPAYLRHLSHAPAGAVAGRRTGVAA